MSSRLLQEDCQAVLDGLPDMVARIDQAQTIVYANRAMVGLLGLGLEECVGCALDALSLPAEFSLACRGACDRSSRTKEEQGFSFSMGHAAGQRHYRGRVIPEADRGQASDSVLLIIYDITESARLLREREALLASEKAARSQAESAARARDQFLAVVSHELRSPLNGIQSWSHVLQQQTHERSPLFERALAGIRTGVEQQVRLIEDLLDATRILSGQLRLARRPFVLRAVVEAAVISVRAAAAIKAIRIEACYDIEGGQVDGDPDRVQQIVWNLLDNAVKFTGHGGTVKISVSRSSGFGEIVVSDNGRGISPDFLPYLFDRFRQADGSSTRGHEGLGLGLALVKHLSELHGGVVEASSAGRGLGARFSVRLPLRMSADPAQYPDAVDEDHASLPALQGLLVLVVDDQRDARESLYELLTHAKAEVVCAASCQEALLRMDELGPSRRPDVLLCDIAMPDEDGYLTLRKVRAWESERGITGQARMPAVALTAFALREDRIRALSAGYKMHLAKPVTPAELIVVLAAVAGASHDEAA